MRQTDEEWPFRLQAHLRAALKDSWGQGLVEYVLVLALVALGSVAAEQTFACELGCAFENVGYEIGRIYDAKQLPPGQVKNCSKKCG
jgi:Flp pilus assembly pilin Flp